MLNRFNTEQQWACNEERQKANFADINVEALDIHESPTTSSSVESFDDVVIFSEKESESQRHLF